MLWTDCQKPPQKTLCRDKGSEDRINSWRGMVWRVVHSVPCWSSRLRQEGGKKEAHRIETEMIMGMERSSAMADAQFEKKANKIIESIKVHGIHK